MRRCCLTCWSPSWGGVCNCFMKGNQGQSCCNCSASLLSFKFAFIVDFTPPTGVGVGFVLRNDLHLLTRSVLSDLTRTSWWATRCSCILGATSFSGPQHLEWICASSCHECQVEPGATESSPCCGTQYGSSGDAEVKIWGFWEEATFSRSLAQKPQQVALHVRFRHKQWRLNLYTLRHTEEVSLKVGE